jgi:pyrroloquinoline quinone biosynthesis protein D
VNTLPRDQRPRLSRAARLRFDARTNSYVLLSPERGLRLNESANLVVQRCTGELTVQEIIGDLVDRYAADFGVTPAQLTDDVIELFLALKQRRLLDFEPRA